MAEAADSFGKTRFVAGSDVPGMRVCHSCGPFDIGSKSTAFCGSRIYVEENGGWRMTSGAEAHYLWVTSTARLKTRPFKANL